MGYDNGEEGQLMESLDDAYEQLLQESIDTIIGLRLKLAEAEAKLVQPALPQPDAFDDSAFDDEWDFAQEYCCPQCGAPLSEPQTGRCGMPCI